MKEKKEKKVYTEEEKAAFRKAGRRARTVGYNAERRFALLFRQAGWKEALTMRYVSKFKDDRKIDIAFIPVNMQIKAGTQSGMNPRKYLEEMKIELQKLPDHYPEKQHHCVVVHPRTTGQGNARTEFDDIVYMTWKDYMDLLCMLHDKGKYTPAVALLDEEGNPIAHIETEEDAKDLSQPSGDSQI
jgi:hypothetical protein